MKHGFHSRKPYFIKGSINMKPCFVVSRIARSYTISMYRIRMIFGENLREIRKSRGLTQEGLSSITGISTRAISEIERGEAYPSPENLDTFCTALGRTPAEFFLTESQKDSTPEHLAYLDKIRELRKRMLDVLEKEEEDE